jgi:hypothetical protein
MSRITVIAALEADRYPRHPLHFEQRTWPEKNCYVDIWIELTHTLQLDPHAMLAGTLAIDFIGDQWTFFKPSHADLWGLYGIDVEELTVWRPLVEHAEEHLAAGRLICTESDAWWLPDTAGSDYRTQHTKTSIILNDIDVQARRLGYFHNGGYHSLSDVDFDQLLRVAVPGEANSLPLFAEWVAIDRRVKRSGREMAQLATALLEGAVQRMPAINPVARFKDRYLSLLDTQAQRGLGYYHSWAFANTRQLGASFELAQSFLLWLGIDGGPSCQTAAAACERISTQCKTLILKGARAAVTGRSQGIAEMLETMTLDWQVARDELALCL